MRAAFACAAAIVLMAAPMATPRAQAASWLDGSPSGWNTPGQAAPPPAPAAYDADSRCIGRETAPRSPEESRLAAAGWKLESYWSPDASGDSRLITALAGYDGMCRPKVFNVFVFSGGIFAGTLAPEPMSSRTDGVLATPGGGSGVQILPNGTIHAVFTRYATNDPLCCPSRGQTSVTYQIRNLTSGPVVVPVLITSSVQAAQAPSRLPKTGEGGASTGISWLFWPVVGALVVGGLRARRLV